MKVSQVKCAIFSEATPVLLRDAINNFTRSLAAGTAPVNYAAGVVKEQTFIDIQYFPNGATFTAMLFYTE